MFYRTVPGLQTRGITIKPLSAREPVQDIADNRRVRVELRDVASDIVVRVIAKQGEFCLVGPQDNAFTAHNVKTYRAVFEEIFEVRGFASHFTFQRLALGNVLEAADGSLDLAAVVPQGDGYSQGQ